MRGVDNTPLFVLRFACFFPRSIPEVIIMKALVLERPGAFENLHLADVPQPEPGPGEAQGVIESAAPIRKMLRRTFNGRASSPSKCRTALPRSVR